MQVRQNAKLTAGVLIGRWQPFHNGHLEMVKLCSAPLEDGKAIDRLYLGIGSSNAKLSEKNPFTLEERTQMILRSVPENLLAKIIIFAVPDTFNDGKWMTLVEKSVEEKSVFERYVYFSSDKYMADFYGIFGHDVAVFSQVQRDSHSGTNVRKLMIQGEKYEHLLPSGTLGVINEIDLKSRLSEIKRNAG